MGFFDCRCGCLTAIPEVLLQIADIEVHPDFEQTGNRDDEDESGPNKKLGLNSFAEERLHDQR